MDDSDQYLTGPQVRKRYHISAMTLWRWLNHRTGFPCPFRMGRLMYFKLSELQAFEERQKQRRPI